MAAPNTPENPTGRFGPHTPEEEYIKSTHDALMQRNISLMRPVENLKLKRITEMEGHEALPIVEALQMTVLESQIHFANRLERSAEGFDYARTFYTVQGDVERITSQVGQIETTRFLTRDEENKKLIATVEAELRRSEAATRLYSACLPYKGKYFSGMASMTLLAERGEQIVVANLGRLTQGVVSKKPTEGNVVTPEEVKSPIDAFVDAVSFKNERGETMSDRYGSYEADCDFWLRVVGEVNTFNPTNKGEKLYLSKRMQQFVGDLLKRRPRILEDGSIEDIELPTRKITVYLDAKGNQIPQDLQGRPIRTPDETVDTWVEVLDPYNKTRSEDEMRWVVSTISAMAVLDAKLVLDGLPPNINHEDMANDADESKYNILFKDVQKLATELMENYDSPPTLDLKIARSAYYLADAVGFGTFDVAERGFSHEWKPEVVDRNGRLVKLPDGEKIIFGKDGKPLLVDKDNIQIDSSGIYFRWHVETSQGDPTSSGDAFSAARPFFHEVVYQAIKNRISVFNTGVMLPVDPDAAEEMAQIFVSEAAEINNREKIMELLKAGKQQQHLVKFFGVLGAFEEELGKLPAWRDGENMRITQKKKINPNLSKAVEELVVFSPTPFSNDVDGKLIYPIITHQFKIGLYDMLSAGKDYSVGDMLRKTWKKVEVSGPNGSNHFELQEATPDEGGKRLTHKDINWLMYARFADDSRAVNNNFMFQLFQPLYGTVDPKAVEAAKHNPTAAITAAVKAADIGLRWVIQKFKKPRVDKAHPEKNSGKKILRPTMEIMHASGIAFQQLALAAYGLVGRGAIDHYEQFTEEKVPQDLKDQPNNLYTVLRNIEDFLPVKQGYADYADSFFCMFLANSVALGPISIASDEMAKVTTKRFEDNDTTQHKKWKTLSEKGPK